MSNLSDLKAAGGSGKSIELVASGALSNGDKVVLKSNGTVSAVTGVNEPQYIPWSGQSSFRSQYINKNTTSYNPLDSTRFVTVFSSSGGQLVVGTVTDSGSSSSIAYSSIVGVTSNSVNEIIVKFQPNSNNFLVMYQDDTGSKYGVLKLYTLSGTTVTLQSTQNFDTGGNSSGMSMEFSTNTAGMFLLGYCPYNTGTYGKTRAGQISGSSFSMGTEVTFESSRSHMTAIAPLYGVDSFVMSFKNLASGNDGTGQSFLITVSGTTVTTNSHTQWSANSTEGGPLDLFSAGNMNTANSFCITFRNGENNTNYQTVISGSVSGTTVSFGSKVALTSWSANNRGSIQSYGDNKFLISYDGQYTGSNPQYGLFVRPITLSGTTISLGTQVQMIAPGSQGGTGQMDLAFQANNAQFAVSYRGASTYGYAILGEVASVTTNLTSTNFVGISEGAFADTATATVMLRGGITTTQSGLTIGSKYYVQTDGTLSTTADSPSVVAGQAISATTILIEGET